MKLHLGCGKKILDGYENIDLPTDVRFIDSGDVEEILAVHVVEHFLITEVLWIIKNWYKALDVGGSLIVELPCWDSVRRLIKADASENMTRWALYGEPSTHKDGFPAVHKWCYSKDEMRKILELAGFSEILEERPKYHVPERDMRFVAIK